PKNHAGSLQQYEEVQENASIFDIVKVIGELASSILHRGAIWAIYLRPAGNAGSHPMPFSIVRDGIGQLGDEKRALRAGSDKTHQGGRSGSRRNRRANWA